MKLYRKIDPTTGNFLEDCLFESQPLLTETLTTEIEVDGVPQTIEREAVVLDTEWNPLPDPQYIDVEVPQGFYLPKWNGTEWVEGGVAPKPVVPEPSDSERISSLEIALLEMLMM